MDIYWHYWIDWIFYFEHVKEKQKFMQKIMLHKIESLKVPWHDIFTLWGFLRLMSSPSLPVVPQKQKIGLGVKQAVGILLRLWKNESSNVLIWGQVPFSALPAQRIWPVNKTMT